MKAGTLSLPGKEQTPEDRATREKVVLALLPVLSKHGLEAGRGVVEIAIPLCEYIASGRKQDTPSS